MTFVAFLIWVLIVAGTGYMLWKLIFQDRMGNKDKDGYEPMAVKTEEVDGCSTDETQDEDFSSDVVSTQEAPAEVEEAEQESADETSADEAPEEDAQADPEEEQEPEKDKQ